MTWVLLFLQAKAKASLCFMFFPFHISDFVMCLFQPKIPPEARNRHNHTWVLWSLQHSPSEMSPAIHFPRTPPQSSQACLQTHKHSNTRSLSLQRLFSCYEFILIFFCCSGQSTVEGEKQDRKNLTNQLGGHLSIWDRAGKQRQTPASLLVGEIHCFSVHRGLTGLVLCVCVVCLCVCVCI